MASSERTEPGAHSEVLGATGQQIVVGHRTGVDRRRPLRRCLRQRTNSMASGSSVRSSAITSSVTQSVPSASRANWAVSTASAAPRQPAVLGSGVMPSRLSRSSTPVPPTASTRRIATVIQLGARRDQCLRAPRDSFAPPVPMISREVNSRPAIVSLDSAALHRC